MASERYFWFEYTKIAGIFCRNSSETRTHFWAQCLLELINVMIKHMTSKPGNTRRFSHQLYEFFFSISPLENISRKKFLEQSSGCNALPSKMYSDTFINHKNAPKKNSNDNWQIGICLFSPDHLKSKVANGPSQIKIFSFKIMTV